MEKVQSASPWKAGAATAASTNAAVARLAERLRVVMGLIETLEQCGDEEALARGAVELARERLGIERGALFLREGEIFRGTFGTDMAGVTTTESECVLDASTEIGRFAHTLRLGSRTWSKAIAPWVYYSEGKRHEVGRGELALSVLRTARGPIGLFFNDNAISGQAIDDELQEAVAIYASLLANLIERQRGLREQENARELFERIFNAVPSSIVIYSEPHTILTANVTARRIYGLGEETPLSGLHLSALGLTPQETDKVIEQNRRLFRSEGQPVDSDEIPLHVMGRRKYFRRLKFPITMPGSGRRAILSISSDVTELRESLERQRSISAGLRRVVAAADELASVRDERLFFRRAIEFCRDELGVERCSIFIDEGDCHIGTWGTDENGNIVDESAYRVPISEGARKKWRPLVEESSTGYHLHDGDLSQCPGGEINIVGRGTIAVTLIRSHNEVCGVFYNDNLLTGAPIDTALQEVLTVFCSILGNLIARRALEEERTRSARQYQNLFEQTPTANFMCDIDGRIVACNRPFALLLGFENQFEALDQRIGEFLAPRDSVRLLQMIEKDHALSGETIEAHPARGEKRIVAAHVSSIRGDSNTIIGYQGFLVDTTDQVRGEQALQELARATVLPGGEGFFPALLEGLARVANVPHIVLCESVDGRPMWLRVIAECGIAVPAGEEFLCENIPGEAVLRLGEFHQERGIRESFPECAMALTLEAEGFYGLTLSNSAGLLVGAIGLFSTKPLTLTPRIESIIRIFAARAAAEIERTRAEHALRESESRFLQAQKLEALGRFAGSIAHDFNNLLTTILTLSDLATDTLPPGHPVREDIIQINRIGHKAGSLTRQLLNFGRAHSRDAGALQIASMIGDLKSMLERLLGESIRLELEVDASTGAVLMDKSQFEQVIVNLAVNARDAMPRGGLIRVVGKAVDLPEGDTRLSPEMAPGSYALLQFSDTGEGIDPEHLSRIFEPFFSTKDDTTGTGLGLFTVYSIVNQNRGFVSVESAPGKGTAFTILLPQTDVIPVEEELREEAPIDRTGSHHETVLLAEDDETVRHSIEGILRRFGYNVLSAPGGGEALLTCERHPGPINLLLTDVRMPHMNGFELAQRVRRLRPGIRVVFMSGYIDNVERRNRPPGADILAKPFSSKVLNAWIRRALDAPARDLETPHRDPPIPDPAAP